MMMMMMMINHGKKNQGKTLRIGFDAFIEITEGRLFLEHVVQRGLGHVSEGAGSRQGR